MKDLFILAAVVLLNIVLSFLFIGSVIWVYNDAAKYKRSGVKIMSPLSWSIWTLLIWIIFFPLYIITDRLSPGFSPGQ